MDLILYGLTASSLLIASYSAGKPAPQEMSAADVGDKKPTALEIDSRDVVNELNKFEEDVSQLRVVERFFNGRFFNFVEKARYLVRD